MPTCPWPPPNIVAEVKAEGFDLLSKECVSLQVSFGKKKNQCKPN